MNERRQRTIYVLVDFALSAAAWFLFNLLRYHEVAHNDFETFVAFMQDIQVVKGQILLPIFWLALYFFSGYYNKPFHKLRVKEMFSTFTTTLIGAIIIFFVVVLNELPESFHIYYKFFFALSAFQFTLVYLGRYFITKHTYRKVANHEWTKNAVVVGTGRNAAKIKDGLYSLGYLVKGYVKAEDGATSHIGADEVLGGLERLSDIIAEHAIDEIIIATDNEDVQLLYSLYTFKLPVKIIIEKNNIFSRIKVKTIQGIPLLDVTENNFSEAEKNIKWLLDKLISILALVVLSPLYAILAIKVKADSPGAVFFKQERIGYRGKPFTIYKFRTMYADAAKQGPLLTARDDKRVTPFGHFLRKYRLDEIPQFWNVLCGDMSLVGPRPEQRYYIDRIVLKAPYYYLLHNVRPGITSWGMVKYGYAETVEQMIERLDYDILYYENMSLTLDTMILIYTIKTVFTGKGV